MFFLFENVSSPSKNMAGDGFSRASPGREDPANPKVLTLNQFNKAITVRFQHTKSFHLSFWAHLKFFVCEVLDFPPTKTGKVSVGRVRRSFLNKETNKEGIRSLGH